jgi:hypothetical protein
MSDRTGMLPASFLADVCVGPDSTRVLPRPPYATPGPPASDPRNSWPMPLAKAFCRPSPSSLRPRQRAPSYQPGPRKLPPHLAADKPRQPAVPPAPAMSNGAQARCSGHIPACCPQPVRPFVQEGMFTGVLSFGRSWRWRGH